MTDEKSEFPKGPSNFFKNFTDAATFFGSFALMAWGVSEGPAVAAAAGAVGFPLILMSGVTGMTRMLIAPTSQAARPFCESAGLTLVGQAARNVIKEKSLKTYTAATFVMAFGAAVTGGLSWDGEIMKKEREDYARKMQSLPVLDSKTVIRTDVYTAADLYCVNREGERYRTGIEVPMTYKGQQYKVVCP